MTYGLCCTNSSPFSKYVAHPFFSMVDRNDTRFFLNTSLESVTLSENIMALKSKSVSSSVEQLMQSPILNFSFGRNETESSIVAHSLPVYFIVLIFSVLCPL